MPADAYRPYMGPFVCVCVCLQELVRKVCVRKGMVDEEVKSSVNAYVVYKDEASVDKVGARMCVVYDMYIRLLKATVPLSALSAGWAIDRPVLSFVLLPCFSLWTYILSVCLFVCLLPVCLSTCPFHARPLSLGCLVVGNLCFVLPRKHDFCQNTPKSTPGAMKVKP